MRYCGSKRRCRSSSTRQGRLVAAGSLLVLLFTLALSAPAFGADPTIAAVGDMGCPPTDPSYNGGDGTSTMCRQRYVSDLVVAAAPAALLDLGDNQYDFGELANYQAVYHPTFGRANSVVYPSLGNAEYDTVDAQGFFDYFSSVGVTSRITANSIDASHWANGYYSFDVGTWHMIALNSNCAEGTVGGCSSGRTQEVWLRNDLAAHPNRCTLAYWHHPRWNSGSLGNDSTTSQFWTDLYNAHADVVLNGHGNHHYERFVPQDPSGNPASNGIREFIVSTGGQAHGTPPGTPGDPNTSQVRDYTSFGILKLTLHPTSYDWQFVPEVNGSFTDSGTSTCDGSAATAPSAPTLSATAGDSTVHLSWTTPSDGGAAITGYKVYRGTSAGGETLLKTVGNVTSTDDATAVNGTKYWYRVSAVNSVGEGPQSNEVSATPAPAAPPAPFPSTPVLDSFARSAGALGSGWQSPALQDGGTVSIASSGLTKSSSGAASATWSAAQFAADQEAYLTVPTLPSSTNFMQLAGRVSTLSSSTVSCYFLRVTPSSSTWEIRQKLNGATSTLLTSFSSPLVAGDSIGMRLAGSTITVYRKAGSGPWTAVGSTNSTSITAGGYVSFTLGDTTMRGGAFGGGPVTSAQAPAAPTLAATPGDASIHLSWSAPADGGSAITGYKVYRGTASGAETLLKTVGNVTSTDDATAANGTKYWYRVAAVNGVGEGSQSNEVSATPVPAISVSDVTHPEGDSGQSDFTFTVSLSGPSSQQVQVDAGTIDGSATTADSDYAALGATTLTFSPGQTSKTVTVEANGDTTYEPDEGFSVKLSGASGATIADDTGAGTIQNDDPLPQVSIDDVSHPEGDSGQSDFTFTVSLSGPSSQQVQVDAGTLDGSATTADSDYAALGATTLTFSPGQTSKTVTVKANGDTTYEPDEGFSVKLSGASGATIADDTGAGTIQNDDPLPQVSIDDVTHPEGDSGQSDFTFTVSLSGPSASAVGVDYQTADGTATAAGSDYDAAGGTLAFDPGQTSRTVTVKVNGDGAVEPSETFSVELSNPAGAAIADGSGLGTIQNDDLSYARPKGATPLFAPLVIAYQPCGTPDDTHGDPLAGGSCSVPAQASSLLTAGTPDANGANANFAGSVRLATCASPACAGSDVAIRASLADVRCQGGESACGAPNLPGGADYTGELGLTLSLRLTDKGSGTSGAEPATVQELPIPASIPCAENVDLGTGATCSLATTANALLPGTVSAGARAIWQLGQIEVDDAGPDGAVSTPDGAAPFAAQGIFVP